MSNKSISIAERAYAIGQKMTEEKEPFNKKLMEFRSKEKIDYLLYNIMKGLEVIKGVKLKSCIVEPLRKIYQRKKTNEELTKEELEELNKITSQNKGVRKSTKSAYPLTPIKQSRLLNCEVIMEFSDDERTIDYEFNIHYPELVKGQYFYLNGNRFFPVFQLADGEFYRSGKNTIVLKTTFMPINITANKVVLIDSLGNEIGKCRNFDIALFGKHINAMLYYFSKTSVEETVKTFGLHGYIEFIFNKMETYMSKNKISKTDRDDLDFYLFKLSPNLTLKVDKKYLTDKTDVDERTKMGILHTFVTSFKKKHLDEASFYNGEYWKRQLGKQITSNTTKMYEKAESMLLSLERILDVTTKDMIRLDEEVKDTIYTMIRFMINNFESIIIMNTHDLANKRMRVGEYLLSPITLRLSSTVYRLITPGRKVNVDQSKQIFSAISEDYLINQINTISLVRFFNMVNPALSLFSNILKFSKNGPQSQKADNSNNSISLRGMDSSYLGRIDVVSTSSGDPGVSGTLTPFCEICDPNGKGNFYFSNRSNITGLFKEDEEDLEEQEVFEE